MAFELDPLFHTETMAKILKAQGHLQLALKVCHKVLEKDPSNLRVKDLADNLRSPFLRPEAAAAVRPQSPEDEDTEPGITVEELKAQESSSDAPSKEDPEIQRETKLEKLNALLTKIQERS